MKTVSFIVCLLVILIFIGSCAWELVPPPQDNYGLSVESAASGEPLVIDSSTPVLKYKDRLYYFQNQSELDKFKDNPEYYITKFTFNELPQSTPPLVSDYDLKTNCSYNADPIVVTQFTPTLMYMGRIYYFAHSQSKRLFMGDPQMYVAKYPENRVPKTISPLKSAYGTKTVCSATGVPIIVASNTPTLEYMGEIYYFSNIPSMEAFKKDPQAYINKKFASSEPPSLSAAPEK